MLINVDFVDACGDSRSIQAKDRQTEDDAGLVAQHRPAEMDEGVERDEAADTDADENKSGGNRWPHPRLNWAQVRVVIGVELLQALHRLADLEVTHACIEHLNDENQ